MRTQLALAFCLVAGNATAVELTPNHAHSIDLNGVAGVAYYTVEGGTYRVVAVVASGESGRPIRFTATLLPQQRIEVSVPSDGSEVERSIEFIRAGNSITASQPFAALN